MARQLTSGEKRSTFIAKARSAFRKGLSASRFLTQMKSEGLGYRRTDMLSDWRAINELEKKAGSLRYVRRDYYPSEKSIAHVPWKMSREYMYKVRIQTRIAPGEPIEERFVNIMTDKPLTPRQLERETYLMFERLEEYQPEELVQATPYQAVRRVME